MRKTILILVLMVVYQNIVKGQNDGNYSFRFLDVPVTARLSGLGGINVSRSDVDVNLISSNPALISSNLDGNLSLNYILYPADIKVSNITYSNSIGATGNWTANLVYFNYGEIEGYDETGFPTGSFRANDYAVTIGKSHQSGNYRIGANIRFASSQIGEYSASAFLADLGGVYIHPQSDFTVGMILKNLGAIVKEYSDQSDTELPFDLQVGTSFKPRYMPVRFSITLYDLTNWSNPDPESALMAHYESPSALDSFFMHTIFGAELVIGKYVNVLLGYDHKKRKQLQLSSANSGAGFSYGLMVSVKAFQFGFSRSTFHASGASNTFTLTSDLNSFFKKKSIIE